MLHAVAQRSHRQGDGYRPETYGFALGNFALPAGSLVASGLPRDGIPALTDPGALNPSALQRLGRRFLLPSDLVAGVAAGGEARAYPLRVLVFHEVANDTLGGEPIAVVHQPLCGVVAVFSRNVGAQTLTFANSGLLWNSCGLLFDRESQSLWLPLAGKAVAGPRSGEALRFLPFTVTTWQRWQALYPQTTLVQPDLERLAQYRRDPYSSYLGSDILRFPVSPPLPAKHRRKTPLVVLFPAENPVVVALHAGTARAETVPLPGLSGAGMTLTPVGTPAMVEVRQRPTGELLPVLYTYSFAWYALHPERDPSSFITVGSMP